MIALAQQVRRLIVFMVLAAALAAAAMPAQADDAADRLALDKLFAALKAAPDETAAHQIDQQIWMIWTSPSDPDLRLRMLDVLEARQMLNLRAALELCDRLVVDYPTYAEGWNQRATIHFMLGEYDSSLADIEKVLQYEPRHFGALAGRVLIHLARGDRALALKEMREALAVHPFLGERHLFPELQQQMTRT